MPPQPKDLEGRSVAEPHAHETSEELAKLRAGNEQAFSALVDRLHRSLLRLAETFVGRGAAAEEVVQEAWLAALEGLERFEGRSSIKTWIGGIVVNRARTRRGKDAREIPMAPAEDESMVDPSHFRLGFWSAPPRWDPAPDDLLERRRARDIIVEEIDRLPPGQRAVVTLREMEEWTSEEVCNVLGLSETNQRVLLHRARARLRMALEKRLGKEPLA
jgi:RNA polymerase sigma-70 factor (ECF subfamily)